MSKWVKITDWAEHRIRRQMLVEAEPLLIERAKKVKNFIQANISDPFPPASAPGEFPHRRTGDLREGIKVGRVSGSRGDVVITSDAPQALDLELGGEHVQARPFMRRSLLAFRRLFSRIQIHR